VKSIFYRQRKLWVFAPVLFSADSPLLPLDLRFLQIDPSIPPSCLPQSYSSAPSPTTRRTSLRAEAASISTCPNETQREELGPEGGDLAVSSRFTMSLPRLSSRSATKLLCLTSTPTGQMLKVCLAPFAAHLYLHLHNNSREPHANV